MYNYEEEDWDADPVSQPETTAPVYYQPPEQSQYNGGSYGQKKHDTGFGNSGRGREFNNRENRTDTWKPRQRDGGDTRRNENYNNYGDSGGDSDSMRIPSRFVGRIIGKGGSKIQELQSESGARINVSKELEGDETVIKITGSQDQIDKAKELINELAQDNNKFGRSNDMPRESRWEPREQRDYKPAPMVIDWQAQFRECERATREQFDSQGKVVKNFYKEHPEISAMTQEEVEVFRNENNNIVVDRTFKKDDSKPIPKPCKTFEHAFHNYPEILQELEKAGFEKPSPIQCQAWPVLLSGEDLIGIAQTGTGKTLAFILPAMIHLDGQTKPREERDGPSVLIMAPTRELALQIDKEVKKYQYKGITAVCLYGGGNRREQVSVVRDGVDIIIATPGRLNDLVATGQVNLKSLTYVVLDEADRMLDMGFEPQIRKILYAINPSRQTVMTSATWPIGVRRLAQTYMEDPVQVYIGSLDLAAVHTVTQTVTIMDDTDEAKLDALLQFIQNMDIEDKIIVFCGKKSRADEISSELSLIGIPCQTMHGDRDQNDRVRALEDITDGTVQILIATDVASRGLDIQDVTHVINFDFPRNIEEYVHRVGRTGRAGRSGQSISYFTRSDWGRAKELIGILEEAAQYVPEELVSMADRFDKMKEKRETNGVGGYGGGRPRFGGRGNGFNVGSRW